MMAEDDHPFYRKIAHGNGLKALRDVDAVLSLFGVEPNELLPETIEFAAAAGIPGVTRLRELTADLDQR
jgi:hypothetical protein